MTEMGDRHGNRDVPWWRYRNEPLALQSISFLLLSDAGERLDPTWCFETARDIDAHLQGAT